MRTQGREMDFGRPGWKWLIQTAQRFLAFTFGEGASQVEKGRFLANVAGWGYRKGYTENHK